MARLEELTRGAAVQGILANGLVTVVDVQWHGTNAVELVYKNSTGQTGNQLLFRDDETGLEIVTAGQPWRFDADGYLLRLVSEAQRIRLAHLFDPYLAVHTSLVEPLPHQITAVYEKMLPRQPLRFLLADDPGAGKTIMAGLYIKELMIRGDLRRCLVVCPGSLTDQWQDELWGRFHLPFELLTLDRIESARTGNVFQEIPLLICRLDRLARNDDLQTKLMQTDWDLVVCDEAHKMSASYFGGEVSYTKRYRLGQKLSQITRHFLLMTATPHNGKEGDFQLFMALLDGDRFEGRYRDGVHATDVSDLMRRMVKEELVKFDGKPLFPERRATTVPYKLSDLEARLYAEVTEYVREEFDRVAKLQEDGRTRTVGFALTILQRRLASSPEAIYQSLKRRRERLGSRLREAELVHRGIQIQIGVDPDLLEDPDDLPAEELERAEEELVDQATAARTIQELRIEIGILQRLERLADRVRHSGTDRKWEELRALLQDPQMFDRQGARRKLVIFTEHRDTLSYLVEHICTLLGRPEAVVTIHGGTAREARRNVQEAFTQDPEVQILVATDAAGEGINLQRAHLMINYDLPWNPNRLEQRFGRIHRIGQTEVCHLWNLVAEETREGDVYLTLLRKLEQERESLGGAIFDVLGKAINGKQLRELMIEAIRYGDRPEVRARLNQVVAGVLDRGRLQALLEEEALARDSLDTSRVYHIRQEMERMAARRLQPHYIASFFRAAFEQLGGTLRERETGRYEVTHVPAAIRHRDRVIGTGEAVLSRYERICFEKELISVQGKPQAAFVCPGHPLLDATVDLVLERYRDLMKQGAVLVDENDPGEAMRALFYLEHTIQDGRSAASAGGGTVSRRMQFVELPLAEPQDSDPPAPARDAGPAPYLDYRPLAPDEQTRVEPLVAQLLSTQDLETQAISYAISHIVPRHLADVRREREPLIDKIRAAVQERLTKEIAYWDHRAQDLKAQEQTGKINARINSEKARRRADELEARLRSRLAELELERKLAPKPPVATGGALVIPAGLLARLRGSRQQEADLFAQEKKRVEEAAMAAVMVAERRLGYQPKDVSQENLGYDIESVAPEDPEGSRLRLIEVKGRIEGARAVTLSRNEILTALNKPDDWILALVEVPPVEAFEGDVFAVREGGADYGAATGCAVRYLRMPFRREPDFDAIGVNYDFTKLWQRGTAPS